MTYTIGDVAADILVDYAEQKAVDYDRGARALQGPGMDLRRDRLRQIAVDLRLAAQGINDGEGVTRR